MSCTVYGQNFIRFAVVSGVSRAKIEEVTLNALRTRQSLVKGERLVRHEMRAVMHIHTPKPIVSNGFPQSMWKFQNRSIKK